VEQLGVNAHGEVLEAGRVPDCYLGLRLDPADDAEAPGVLVVAPAALLHPAVPQPDGTLLYELLTGHPDPAAHELVVLADLTVELRAWPFDTWAKLGMDPHAAADAVIAAWRGGHLKGLQLGGLTVEEALALERPAMTYVREQLRQRLARQVGRAWWRWLHPQQRTLARRPIPVAADTRRLRWCPRWIPPVRTVLLADHPGHRRSLLRPSGLVVAWMLVCGRGHCRSMAMSGACPTRIPDCGSVRTATPTGVAVGRDGVVCGLAVGSLTKT
jgi:hypothetical protein